MSDPQQLSDLIKRRIRQQGPMDLGEYMSLCLGHPEHGYYMTRDPFGAGGDFTTAPEISQMFGEMIGLWLADLWMKMGSPSEFILLECGPGRGTLMEDIMRSTKSLPGFHAAAKLHLMEISPVLRSAQSQRLSAFDPVWIDDTTRLPSTSPVLMVGNEFLDALPIRQVIFKDGWKEIVIGLDDNDTFVPGLKEADQTLLSHIPDAILQNPPPRLFEVSSVLNQFVKSLSIVLKKQKGAALLVDYGHTHTSPGETLQAMRSHRFTSIFDTPGHTDLTAHVDFENVGRLAKGEGIAVHGPVTQNAFLRGLGIEVRADRLSSGATTAQRADLQAALHRLIDTDQMGDLFKVMALCHDPDHDLEPAGF